MSDDGETTNMKNEKYSGLDDLLIISLITFMTIFVMIIGIKNQMIDILRTIFGIVIILFIPGYLLVSAIFPKKDDLDNIERVALGVGLSIAIIPIMGFTINYFFDIKLTSILLSLFIYFALMIAICIYRRKNLPQDIRYSISIRDMINRISTYKMGGGMGGMGGMTDKVLTVILIFTIIFSVYNIYNTFTIPKLGERFTEFYIDNSSGYSTNTSNIRLGISNYEYDTVNYTINIMSNNKVLLSQDITLGHNQVWENDIYKVGESDEKLEFLLFKERDFIRPYRELHLTVSP